MGSTATRVLQPISPEGGSLPLWGKHLLTSPFWAWVFSATKGTGKSGSQNLFQL